MQDPQDTLLPHFFDPFPMLLLAQRPAAASTACITNNRLACRTIIKIIISDNLLTGQLPPKISLLTSVKSVKLSNNRFSGTVGEDIYYIPSLSVLQLSGNRFVGTTPPAIG